MSLTCPQCAKEFPEGTEQCPDDGATLVAKGDWEGPTRARYESGATPAPARKTNEDKNLTGKTIGEYVVGELLGIGGMGEVYLAEQSMIGRKVAIKVLKGEVAADAEAVKRMLTEARAVNAIRHRGIADIFSFGTLPDGRPYLVMEYLVGEPLDVMLKRRGPLQAMEVAEYLEEICASLHAAHAAGVIHRDLKPANVFIITDQSTGTRYVKLLDFGLAKAQRFASTGPETQAGFALGTPDYIAPEQARGHPVSAQTDLYSLGVMSFELLTGQVPFASASVIDLVMMHVNAPPPRVSSRVNGVPQDLEELVLRLMAKSPDDRPASADEVRLELKRIRLALRQGSTQISVKTSTTGRNRKVTSRATDQAITAQPPSGALGDEPSSEQLPQVGGGRRLLPFAIGGAALLLLTGAAIVWKATHAEVEPDPQLVEVSAAAQPTTKTPAAPAKAADDAPPKPPEPQKSLETAKNTKEPSPKPPVVATARAAQPEAPAAPVPTPATAKRPPTAAKGPSQAELYRELDRVLRRPRSTRMSDKMVAKREELLRGMIKDASSPADRDDALREIHLFESVLTGGH